MLPASWLPPAKMARIILHWTGGGYKVSTLDRVHYHVIIDGDGRPVRGLNSIKANERIRGAYAAHTRGINTGSIGVAVACMAGARERPFHPGRFPMRPVQLERMIEAVTQLCQVYQIPVTPQTVLSHAEVQNTLGVAQNGKWDFTWLPIHKAPVGARAAGDYIRMRVQTFKPEI